MKSLANILAGLILKTTLKHRTIRELPEVTQPASSRKELKPSPITPNSVPFLQVGTASHRLPEVHTPEAGTQCGRDPAPALSFI